MEKTEFIKLTAEIFKYYGFIKIRNRFFLDLDRMVAVVYQMGARFSPSEYCFAYNICFKDIHEDYHFETNNDYKNMPEDLGILKYLNTVETINRNGTIIRNPIYFLSSDYTEGKWTKLWEETLHRTFDPYKDNFEKYVKEHLAPQNLGMNVDAYREFVKRNIIF